MIPRYIFLLILFLFQYSISFTQPGKDCSDPFIINALPFTQTGMTTEGFGNDYTESPCGDPFIEGDDFVITYTPVADEKISILLQNVEGWTGLHVLDGCPDAASTCIASDLSPAPGVRLIDDLLVKGGTNYHIVVSTFPAPQSTGFDLTILSNGPPEAGSTCDNPRVVDTLPFIDLAINTDDFGNDYSGTGPCVTDNYLNGNDIVYTYTPASNEAIAIELSNISDFFAGLQVMTSCPDDNPTCIASAINTSSTDDLIIENLFVELGQTYFLVVSTFENPLSVTFDLAIHSQQTCSPPSTLSFNNISESTATTTWQDGALFWNVELVPAGTTPAGIGQQINTSSTTFSGLSPETDYDVYIQSNCAPASLIISGVYDGPRSGGTPKGLELFALHDIEDLSNYGIGSANNGGGSDGEEFSFPEVSIAGGSYIYVASELVEFTEFFGFAPDYVDMAAAINGDDAIELFYKGTVIDQFGYIDIDGSGEIWEYKDGWAARKSEQRNNEGLFDPSKWIYSGVDELEGGATNATCDVPFPVATFTGAPTIYSVWEGPFSFRTLPTPPACDGFFVDQGGFSGPYFASSMDSVTICPNDPDEVVAVSFTSFAVENEGSNCLDELLIYDGNTTSSTLFSSPGGNTDGWCWDDNATMDKGSGNLTGMTIIATNPTGCLTFIFQSNDNTELAGWEASVACQPRVECNAPINLGTNQLSNNFAELIWESTTMNSIQTSISWGLQGILPQDGTIQLVTGNSFLLTGLQPLTSYDFYVAEECDNNVSSGWAGPFTFMTTDCPTIGDVFTNPIPIASLPYIYQDNTNTCYTNSVGEPSADIFFSYTTGECEYSLLLSTCSAFTDFDTYLYLLDNQGAIVDANDESPEGTCSILLNGENRFSVLETPVAPNTTYFIMVEGFGPNQGNFELTIGEGNISPIGIDQTITEVTCWNDNDGAISLNPVGGATPYTYLWNTMSTSQEITGLAAGIYEVTVEDACNHISTAAFELTNPDTLTIEAIAYPTDPGQANGYVVSEVEGGVPPYNFIWDDGTTTSTIIDRAAGEYCVRVTDARGCMATDCAEIMFDTRTMELPGLEVLQVVPNPVSSLAQLTVRLSDAQNLHVQLLDIHGRIMQSWSSRQVIDQTFMLDFSQLPQGLYLVKVLGEEGSKVVKVIKGAND